MALIKCKECQKEISNKAKTCPHCGVKTLKSHFVLKTFIIVGLLGFLGTLSSEKEKSNDPADYALHACREFIKDSLHDPSSVEFDREYPKGMLVSKNTYTIQISLRAKNGFGALRHTTMKCMMKYDNQSWTLVSLKELN